MRVSTSILMALAFGALLSFSSMQQVSSQQQLPTPNQILEHEAQVELGLAEGSLKQPGVSGGVVTTYREMTDRLSVQPGRAGPSGPKRTVGCSSSFPGEFKNVKASQDCSLRRQAEEFIAFNPTDPDNIVAGQNDSRLGFNHCGIDFSFDRGRTWGDMTPPFWQFMLLDGHVADAGSDPAITFDADGNAYFTCIIFDAVAAANAIVVAKSNKEFGGSFFHSPANIAFQTYRTLPLGVVATDTDPTVANDKEFINADRNPGSPKKNNVYVTWTRFSGGHSPIYFSQSTDGGATWSPGVEIDGSNLAICTSPVAGPCNDNQGSWPEVGPDGTLYVFFGNTNTPGVGINQIVMVKCPGSADCLTVANWTSPVKVADLIGTHPRQTGSNPVTGCPGGRRCLPPNGYRVPEITSITGRVDPTNPSRLFVTWADFRNGGPPCNTGSTATSVPPCNNDVFLAVSTNGGTTWGSPIDVTPAIQFGPSAQWQPWNAMGPDGTLYVAYYDRHYGDCEFTGCNDITLAVTRDQGATFAYHRITTASMPNLVVANNPLQAGFLGDYMGIDANSFGAGIVWGDTRGRDGAVDEDMYFAFFPAGKH